MSHVTDDDLVLHFYGEPSAGRDVTRHLDECARCAGVYAEISGMLSLVAMADPPEPGEAFWAGLQRQGPEREAVERFARPLACWPLLVWIVPFVYPLVPSAIFHAAQLVRGRADAGLPLMVAALVWAFSGPVVALVALARIEASAIHRRWHRLTVYGALAATVSPALFNLTSRTTLDLPVWYLTLAAIALAASVPASGSVASATRLRTAHRWSALLIIVFAIVHLTNNLLAIVNVPTHSAVLAIVRMVYRHHVVEVVLLGAIMFQTLTGGVLVWRKHVGGSSHATNVQAHSGAYLAVFFVAHVSAALLARPTTDTNFVWAAGKQGLLAAPGLTLLLPYYLLGVVALIAHVGEYARIRISGVLPDVLVQRLSYAVMAVGSMVVFSLGLALCGVNLVP